MPAKDWVILLLTHPLEFKTLVQFWLYHQKADRDIEHESQWKHTAYNRGTMKRCWEFLDLTSRSFAAVIKELDGDLARTICLFYLVLRGLDTIEDDMTLSDATKQPLLRSFHEKTVTPGWTFNGSGPDEKDRQLLVEYEVVTHEINLLDPASREVIVDICKKMQTGMADYAHAAATSGSIYLEKIEDYDLYCHYVAGVVGEGVSRLFTVTGKESPLVAEQLELSNSMGLFLQKTNIIRDFREDADERRFFWPREIWGRSDLGGPAFKEMAEMHQKGRETQALWVLSAMVVDALRHAEDCLDYLKLIKNQTVFNFCAIPQVMAIATQELVFMNPLVFQRNVKIRKALAADLIMRATNPRDVSYIFRDFARKIHKRASPQDPSFLRLSIACGRIEQWCERQYPSFVNMPTVVGNTLTYNADDARSKIVKMEVDRERDLELKAKGIDQKLSQANKDVTDRDAMMFVGVIVVGVLVVSLGIAFLGVQFAERMGTFK